MLIAENPTLPAFRPFMLRKPFSYLPVLLCCLLYGRSNAQLKDLCGMWIVKSYQCYTTGPGGVLNLYYIDEVVLITHNGALTTATKVTGDPCVTAGQKSWEGNYTANPFGVSLTMGSPSSPGNSQISTQVNVTDSAHLEIGSMKFTRLSCKQIDSLQIPLTAENNACSKCEPKQELPAEVIPNVFTPNKDGINDLFLPRVKEPLSSSELSVYNRWGTTVFKTGELYKAWDGQSEGAACTDGIYFWIYSYTGISGKSQQLKGFVSLFH